MLADWVSSPWRVCRITAHIFIALIVINLIALCAYTYTCYSHCPIGARVRLLLPWLWNGFEESRRHKTSLTFPPWVLLGCGCCLVLVFRGCRPVWSSRVPTLLGFVCSSVLFTLPPLRRLPLVVGARAGTVCPVLPAPPLPRCSSQSHLLLDQLVFVRPLFVSIVLGVRDYIYWPLHVYVLPTSSPLGVLN